MATVIARFLTILLHLLEHGFPNAPPPARAPVVYDFSSDGPVFDDTRCCSCYPLEPPDDTMRFVGIIPQPPADFYPAIRAAIEGL